MVGNRLILASQSTDVESYSVGKGRIITTSKLLLGIVLGKRIVSDSWITESAKAKQVLDPDQYLVRDEDHNDQWGRCLGDVFDDPLPELFSGKILYFSPALKAVYKSGFKDIEKIAEAAGATKVISKAWTNPKDGEEIIPMGLEEGDAQVTKMREKDVVCYSKDLLSHSILRGKLSLDDDDLKIGTKKGKDRLRRPSE